MISRNASLLMDDPGLMILSRFEENIVGYCSV